MTKERFIQEVRESEATLYRVSKSILHNEQYCLDAVQEAICKAFANLTSLKNEALFKTWLVRILINECYKIQKYYKKIICFDTYMCSREDESREQYTDLYYSIESLKPKIKVVVVLHYIEGFSIVEIGGILKIPEGTVKSRLAKGRQQLRLNLSEEGMYL